MVVLATDGLFDNLTEKQIIDEISKLKVNVSSCNLLHLSTIMI